MGLAPVAVDLNTSSPLRLAATFRQLHKLVREVSPQVVNCHRGEGFLLWEGLRALGHNFALIRTRGDQRPPKGNLPNRLLHQRADALIATNSRTAHALSQTLGIAKERIHTILGGVDEAVFFPDPQGRERVRHEFGFVPEHLVVGLLGRFDRVKGQLELLQALASLRNNSSTPSGIPARLRLLLMGFPTSLEQKDVEDCIQQLHLEDVVYITGKRPDITACINACDLGVIASQGSEAIARAAFEIMVCRVPLIGTDVGVMPDLLDAQALAPTGDAAALESLLLHAAGDPEFRAELARRQSARMTGLGSEGFLRRTLSVYAEAMRRRDLSRLT